jgi:hypothetical protein
LRSTTTKEEHMKTTFTAIALAVLASTAYAAIEITASADALCMPTAVQAVLS